MSLVPLKTKRFFTCPNPECKHPHEFQVEHLFETLMEKRLDDTLSFSTRAGPWYCTSDDVDGEGCGQGYDVMAHADGTVDVEKYIPTGYSGAWNVDGKLRYHFVELTLSASELPLRFKVRSTRFTPDIEPEKDAFFFEEHSCPTNWASYIVEIYDNEGNPDPHGFLKYVGTWPEEQVEDQDNKL